MALEKDIEKEGLPISEYYLQNLKKDRNYRIKQRIVDRRFYQQEFKSIWEKQNEFYSKEFNDKNKIGQIADTIYVHNLDKNKEIKAKDLFHLFFNDIIYYQRGLKSQKGQLADCQFESKSYKNKAGEAINVGVKVAPRSHPFFQEFRIWQTIHNLKIIRKEAIINDKLKTDIDVSQTYLTIEKKEELFDLFNSSKEISHDAILRLMGFKKDLVQNSEKTFHFKLNYPDTTDFVGNETRALFAKVFKKNNYSIEGDEILNNPQKFNQLWHIIYSLPNETDIISALSNKKYFDFPDNLITNFSKLPEFKSQYASYSVRALCNLLPLLRVGKYWDETNLIPKEKNEKGFNLRPTINLAARVEAIVHGVETEDMPDRIRELIKKYNLKKEADFQGLPTSLACYIAYGRHSEKQNEINYDSIEELKINELIPYNSLRNPVVEKIIRETLKLVKDIWADDNLGRPDFIHVELGREMKNNNKDRSDIAANNTKNRVEKERIAALLKELKYPNFNPDSPADSDKFRIWKEAGGKEGLEIFDELFKKSNAEFVKDADIEKYRLWAEQGYRSPYTGLAIPLSDLFAIPKKYEVDHIIPKSKFYDDSFGNKVVVEAEINSLKNNRLAIQFIDDLQNIPIELSNGKKIRVLNIDSYKSNVADLFTNKKKKRHLLSYEVPQDFIERQLNDTKYISKTVAQLLKPIAKGTDTDDGIVYTSGSITSDLKGKWGLHKLWKEILKPRFERLEGILEEKLIISEDKNGDYHFAKDYKRIDHRHHALDALVIACTTRGHIKYLNSLSSLSNDKKDFTENKEWDKYRYLLNKEKQLKNETVGMTDFNTPWGDSQSFFADVLKNMENLVVSHKPTSKLISKAINKYWKWVEQTDGTWKKEIKKQEKPKDDNKYWVAVRQSLFGQPLGKIHLAEYKKDIDLKKAISTQIEFITKHGYKWNTEHLRVANSKLRKRIDGIIGKFSNDEKAVLKHLETNPLYDVAGNKIEKLDLLQFKKYASKRVNIDETFTFDKIKNLPYSEQEKNWLPNLLSNHLELYNNNPKEAFKGEALELLYKKAPSQINKVTRKEGGEKIEINNKLLDGDKGVNQYFLIEIYKELDKKTGELVTKRKYTTPQFLEVIERLAKGLNIHDEAPDSQYIVLSPGDLVYVPREGENRNNIDWNNKKAASQRIYIMRSSTSTECYFLPINVASLIYQYDPKTKKGEFDSKNKSEKTMDGMQVIKANCIKLKIDRLGNIKPA